MKNTKMISIVLNSIFAIGLTTSIALAADPVAVPVPSTTKAIPTPQGPKGPPPKAWERPMPATPPKSEPSADGALVGTSPCPPSHKGKAKKMTKNAGLENCDVDKAPKGQPAPAPQDSSVPKTN